MIRGPREEGMRLAPVHALRDGKNHHVLVGYHGRQKSKSCGRERHGNTVNLLSISSFTRRSHSLLGCPKMKRTIVRDVATPPSPTTAPSLLLACFAHVDRTSIRRSTAVSIENTPTNTPAGARVSKSGGGNDGTVVFVGIGVWSNAVGDREMDGGPAECWGRVQYPRHGNGSLSGLRM